MTNTLYLLVDTDIDFVTYIDTGHTTAPINLPSLDTIIAENAHQALQLMNLLRGHTSQLAWSPDGQSLAVGGLSYSARSIQIGVWVYNMSHLQDPPLLMPIPKHEHDYNSAESIAFSPDGKLLAVGSGDDTTRLLDVDNGTEQNILRGHTSTVDAVAFSPDGSRLATGSWGHQILLWNMNSLSIQTVLRGNDDDTYSGMYSLGFSPNGQLLASAGDVLHIWNMATNSVIASIVPPGDYPSVNSLAFSPDGKWLAYGGSQNLLKLWDVEKHTEHLSFELPDQYVGINSLAFNSDGTLLVTGSSDNLVRIWDVQTGQQLAALEGHTNEVRSIAFSPDGKLIASTGYDGTIRLWGVPTPYAKNTKLPIFPSKSKQMFKQMFTHSTNFCAMLFL